TLQWLNPDGFTIFLNAQRVLRDQRYKLLHYSKDELSIQLSNLTVQDEGIYSCFYYSKHFQSKRHNVRILAAPSHPVLEVSQDEGRGIKLSCYTQGSKPQPQISWLLDNGLELSGKKMLQGTEECGTRSTAFPAVQAAKILIFGEEEHPRLGCTRWHCATTLHPCLHQPVLPKPWRVFFQHNQKLHSPNKSPKTPPGVKSSLGSLPGPNLTAQISVPERDPEFKGITKKEKNLLLPILVAALIFVLLIIVLLFMVKLKKAHGVWKRENDVSEQTLESYKSRSNEDSPGHERNGQ
ncbi:CRTAM protein, partial [Erithacus rubecula]|nr:CRTAM protein [Erithacus rubecula]